MGDEGGEAPPQAEEPAAPESAPAEEHASEPAPAEENHAPQPPPAEEQQAPEHPPEEHKAEESAPADAPQEVSAAEERKTSIHEPTPAESAEPKAEEHKPEEPTSEAPPSEETKVDETAAKPTEEVQRDADKRASVVSAKEEKTSIGEKESEKKRGSKKSEDGQLEKKRSDYISSESLDRKGTQLSEKGELKEARKSRSERLTGKARVLGSTISIRRLSGTGEFYDRSKGARFMNTYKLDADNPFKPEKVEKILECVMVEALENLTYDPENCPKQAKWASSAIRARVKELQFDRYKLICLVTIGEKNSQDVLVTCRFLWDVDRDRYATYCIENTYVFGVAQCFGIYYE